MKTEWNVDQFLQRHGYQEVHRTYKFKLSNVNLELGKATWPSTLVRYDKETLVDCSLSRDNSGFIDHDATQNALIRF